MQVSSIDVGSSDSDEIVSFELNAHSSRGSSPGIGSGSAGNAASHADQDTAGHWECAVDVGAAAAVNRSGRRCAMCIYAMIRCTLSMWASSDASIIIILLAEFYNKLEWLEKTK